MTGWFSRACAGTLLVCALGFAPPAGSQSTDGYHTIQIFPVVVDTAAFTQRFQFRKRYNLTTVVRPTFYPGDGSSSSEPLLCPQFEIPAVEGTVTSLRSMCPDLPAGPQFGYLTLTAIGPDNRPFLGFSRVSNAAGIGFSVEAFPAHTFSQSFSVVSGIRRLAATSGSPAFQTNCFIARLNEVEPAGTEGKMKVFYGIGTSTPGSQIGNVNYLELDRGQIVRLLDVFAAVQAPPGDYNDVNFVFGPADMGAPGTPVGALMGFCTVQDNTSFGADFRIAKSEYGICGAESCTWDNPMDQHVNRDSDSGKDAQLPEEVAGRAYSIPAGSWQNSHVFYFRHPDYIQCELLNPETHARLPVAYGLEMRLTRTGGTVLAGGNDVTGFGRLYLGDKRATSNTRYVIQVEGNESVEALEPGARPYLIHCQSGSGHTPGDTVRFNAAIDQF